MEEHPTGRLGNILGNALGFAAVGSQTHRQEDASTQLSVQGKHIIITVRLELSTIRPRLFLMLHPDWTEIFFAAAAWDFLSRTVNTPFLWSAATFSVSTPDGSEMVRLNLPERISLWW